MRPRPFSNLARGQGEKGPKESLIKAMGMYDQRLGWVWTEAQCSLPPRQRKLGRRGQGSL